VDAAATGQTVARTMVRCSRQGHASASTPGTEVRPCAASGASGWSRRHERKLADAIVPGAAGMASVLPQQVSAESVACGRVLYRLVEVEIRPEGAALGDGTHTARLSIGQP
jgi:hypothetical protein